MRQNRQQFAFIARTRSTGNAFCVTRCAARSGCSSSELATDLARLPILCEWTTEDLQMVAGLLVNSMISTVEAILDAAAGSTSARGEIARTAEKQLRLVVLGMPAWRSGPAR